MDIISEVVNGNNFFADMSDVKKLSSKIELIAMAKINRFAWAIKSFECY